MKTPVSIVSIASVSALGHNRDQIIKNYGLPKHFLSKQPFFDKEVTVGALPLDTKTAIAALRNSDKKYKSLDNTVLFAIHTAREVLEKSGWDNRATIGVNFGSSRGATALFEKQHAFFLQHQKSEVLTSPTTTLGNISSWVSHDLQIDGPDVSHSITCSTALHALLNGMAWLQAGFVDKFIVGGSEAPLTDFTLAQIHALKIYAENIETSFPCRALDLGQTQNSMVLGEGAAAVGLELGFSDKALALIEGVGYATETLSHAASLSAKADCLHKAMRMALQDMAPSDVDLIVMHAPGTLKGDAAEMRAIEAVFNKDIPALTTNKWKLGHTFGASGLLSLEMAVIMLQTQSFIEVPYLKSYSGPKKIKRIMVNAVGFGGNAVSVILRLP
ncbi:MAG: beta-ketoacyl synthase N-terminal-like domain-containing protein [Flavobacteriaceae bacterium]|nr:beta-ketoacyl synthase N-terminal-like domain-containing protein [Flavobacteriaceae bacterium]